MKFKLVFIPLLLLGMSACSQTTETKKLRPKLFPDGTYTQSVQLQVFPKNKVPRSIPFRNLVKIQSNDFEVLGFTPFGSKAFEAKGNLDSPKDVKLKFYIEMPKFLTARFIRKTFLQIQKIQQLTRRQLSSRGGSDFYEADDFELAIFEYNNDNIPKSMRAKGESWIAFIELEKYKPLHN